MMPEIIKKSRAQSAIELLILSSMLLFFFVVFFTVIQENTTQRARERQALVVKGIAIGVQDEINLATKSGDGYQRNFSIPAQIGGLDYTINISADSVYVRTLDTSSSIALPVYPVIGQPFRGMNTIRKINGIVYIN
jgi:hypothetical protein